ncbi:MAG: peptidylprolyl isomerase [Proteobacteria bacterium]|nr:peptidylprolyl isomerase [Pseudomonadota bacterium]
MSPMKKAVLVVALLSVAFIAACNKKPDEKAAGSKATDVIAVVSGTSINNAAYDAYARQRAQSRPTSGSPEERKATLDELINRELIYQEGVKQGLDKKPEVAAEIENQKRNIVASATIRAHTESTKFSDEALRKEYETHIGAMTGKEFHARHILVKGEDEAKAIIARLDKGADFATIAKDKSQDTGSAKNGGDLSWFEPGQMVKPFGDAVKAMEKGTYTKTAVQSQFGWHIIKLEDTRDIKPPEFEKVKDNVRNILQSKAVETYLATLKGKAKIEIKGEQAAKPAAPTMPKTEAGK